MEDRNTNTSREHVELGGYCLMPWIWENTVDLPASKSVEFLSGTNPGDIRFNQATRFELALNVKTAKSLGLEFP
jgi:hypothetical protein